MSTLWLVLVIVVAGAVGYVIGLLDALGIVRGAVKRHEP